LGKCRMRQSSPLSSERNKSEFLPPASRTRESFGSTAIAVAVPPQGPTTRHASIAGTFAGKAAAAGSEPDTGAVNQLIEHSAAAAAAGEFLQVECIRSTCHVPGAEYFALTRVAPSRTQILLSPTRLERHASRYCLAKLSRRPVVRIRSLPLRPAGGLVT
jgi:hypothetical protein